MILRRLFTLSCNMNKNKDNRRTFNLAIPIFLQSVFQSFFSTADTYMVSQLSDQAVAAIGIASRPLELLSKIFQMISLGIVIIIPRLLGNNDKKKADEISIYGIFLSMIIGLISSCFFCIFSYNILSVYNVESNVLEKASIYLQIVGIGLVFQSLMIVLTAIVQSYERARSSMYISIFANIVNIGIDLYFIFIIQPGENIGIMCVACSTVFSQFLASFILLFFCNKQIRIRRKTHFTLENGIIILKAGFPAVGETFSYSASQMVITLFISSLGTTVLSGYIYAMNIMLWLSRFPAALGKTSGIIVGALLGEKEYLQCRIYVLKNILINLVVTLICGCIVMIFSHKLLALFTSDVNILRIGFIVMFMEFIALFGKSVNLIMGNVIRSTGNPQIPAFVGIISMWILGVAGSYFLKRFFLLEIWGIEIAFVLDEVFRAGILTKYWLSNKWIDSKYLNLDR